MSEPLTTQLVAELMRDLLTAFPSRHAGQNLVHTAEVYRNGLRGVSGDALRAAVDICIKTDTYFPKIARLRELCTEWTRRNRVVMPGTPASSWEYCGICGARAVLRGGEAQARDDRGKLLWDGETPRMVATPERYVMEHNPVAHHVQPAAEGSTDAA